jgi:hypothetical protein
LRGNYGKEDPDLCTGVISLGVFVVAAFKDVIELLISKQGGYN